MGTTKSRWKRAPIDQRRVAAGRTAPKARFTRRQRSASLPPPLPSGRGGREKHPALMMVIVLLAIVGLGVAVVIVGGIVVRAQQQYEDMQWRAEYYGRPTQPFSTLVPDATATPLPTADDPASRFPALAAPDDSRWVRGSATPLGGGFELRTVPSRVNNDPIQTIARAVECEFIIDAAWGGWAQIRLDDTTAWVDLSTVKLEAGT
ncbi:MAG: hypothetical protein U0703_19075 [Anaerolineae bacterium]